MYPKFSKSLIGSISIIGYKDPVWLFVLDTIPTSEVDIESNILGNVLTDGINPYDEGSLKSL